MQIKCKIKIVSSFLMVILLCACQATPNQEVVTSKNKSLIQEVKNADKEYITESNKIVAEQIKKLNNHLTLQIETQNPQIKINVDAEIISPSKDKIPLVRLKPENFTKKQFKTFSNHFSNGEPLFYRDADKIVDLTKEEILAITISMKGYLTNKDLPEHIVDGINFYLDSFNEDQEKYNEALSKSEDKPYTGELIKDENNKVYSTVTELKAYMGHDKAARFMLWQSKNKTATTMSFENNDYGIVYNYYENYASEPAKGMKMTYDEAKQLAIDTVFAIDGAESNLVVTGSKICYEIESFRGYTKETSPQAYSFQFSRGYNGANIKQILFLRGGSENINYSQQIMPEDLNIVIDDRGVVSLYWQNHTEFVKKIADDVPLMEFSKIQEVFENQCKYKFTWVPLSDDIPKDLGTTIDLNRIE
jgi:hypothetical protein